MKTIFNDPLHWSKMAVGSKLTFGIMVGSHILATTLIGFILYDSDQFSLMILISLVALYFPFLYLFALRKLLLVIEDKKM